MRVTSAHQRASAKQSNPLKCSGVCSQVRRPAAYTRATAQNVHAPGTGTANRLLTWLKDHGAQVDAIKVDTYDMPSAGRPLNVIVAARNLAPGEVALSVPEEMVITLDRVFESEFVAELLTTNKLSEMACLTLFLMYEKKLGSNSTWAPYIRELDKQRARGAQAVESPLLWSEEEAQELLQGSPLLPTVEQRLEGIRKEYEALDTVWFMAGSLFNRYPFNLPTECFSFDLFKQAFATVQASIVHLQGVELAKRFALLPVGPPLLSYSSTSRSMISYDQATSSVRLVLASPVAAGTPVTAWCGPQPNSKLLLNYGLVDENNPFDKLQITITLPASDPLFKAKRHALHEAGLATVQTFDISAAKPLPPLLLPYLRLALAGSEEAVTAINLAEDAGPLDSELEAGALATAMGYVQARLAAYGQPVWKDLEVIADPDSTPRQKVAARLRKIEKSILAGTQAALAAKGAPTSEQDVQALLARLAARPGGVQGLKLDEMFDAHVCG